MTENFHHQLEAEHTTSEMRLTPSFVLRCRNCKCLPDSKWHAESCDTTAAQRAAIKEASLNEAEGE